KANWRGVYQVTFTPDSKRVVVGGFLRERLSALVFDLATGKEVASFPTPTGDGCAPVALSPDGKLIATSGEMGQVQIREMEGGKTVHEEQTCCCKNVRFSDGVKALVGGSAADESLYLWPVAGWTRRTKTISEHCGWGGAISNDGRFVLSEGSGSLISI